MFMLKSVRESGVRSGIIVVLKLSPKKYAFMLKGNT